jgi:hypothetical protein
MLMLISLKSRKTLYEDWRRTSTKRHATTKWWCVTEKLRAQLVEHAQQTIHWCSTWRWNKTAYRSMLGKVNWDLTVTVNLGRRDVYVPCICSTQKLNTGKFRSQRARNVLPCRREVSANKRKMQQTNNIANTRRLITLLKLLGYNTLQRYEAFQKQCWTKATERILLQTPPEIHFWRSYANKN